MKPHEYITWSRLCAYLSCSLPVARDPCADALLRRVAAGGRDVLYPLAKRTIVLEHALRDAEDEIVALEKELRHLREQSNLGVDAHMRLGPDMARDHRPARSAGAHGPGGRQPPVD